MRTTPTDHGEVAPGWARIVLGALALAILAFTIPAYFDTTSNPALEELTGDPADLGSVAGAFLNRQVALAGLALVAAIWGLRQVVSMGAIGLAVFNALDAVFISTAGDGGRGAIAGLVVALTAIAVVVATVRPTRRIGGVVPSPS